jgi:hypothetical protein
MNSKFCPYLGLKDDPNTALGFPSEGNFCHHVSPSIPVRRDHQQNYCLSTSYHACPVIVQPEKEAAFHVQDMALTRRRQITLLKYAGAFLLLIVMVGAISEVGKSLIRAITEPGYSTTNETQDPAAVPAAVSSPSNLMIFANPEITRTPFMPVTTREEAPTPSPPLSGCNVPNNWVQYIIKPTDSLFRLSLVFGISISELQVGNCLGERSILQPGEMIYVPVPPTITPTDPLMPSPTALPQRPYQPTRPTQTPRPTSPPEPVAKPSNTQVPTLEPTPTLSPPPPPTAIPTPTSTATKIPDLPTPTSAPDLPTPTFTPGLPVPATAPQIPSFTATLTLPVSTP